MQTQLDISAQILAQKIGKTIPVLIDAIREDGTVVARSSADTPEIDGLVYIENPPASLKVGQIVNVEIIDADDYDLFAQTIS